MKAKQLIIVLSLILYTFCGFAQSCFSLSQLFDLADSRSVRIAVSKSSLEAASEAVSATRSALFPSINLNVTGSYIGDATLMTRSFSTGGTTDVIIAGLGPQQVSNGRQPTPHWGNSFAMQVSQVIYSGGAVTSSIRMAELGQELALLDVQREQQEVRLLLTGYYLDLYKLMIKTEVTRKNIELTRQMISHMESRYKAGTILKTDITRYELQLENLLLSEVKQREAVSIINHQLTTMLQLADSISIMPDTVALKRELSLLSTPQDVHHWMNNACENNVTIRISELSSKIAEQRIVSARASSLPSVSLVAEDHLFGPYTNDLIPTNANVNAWFVGLCVNYNLSSLWKNRQEVTHSRIEARKAKESSALLREGISNSIYAQYSHLTTSAKELQRRNKQLELASQNYSLMQTQYENGLALITELTDAANLLLSAEMELADAKVSMFYNYYLLRYYASSL